MNTSALIAGAAAVAGAALLAVALHATATRVRVRLERVLLAPAAGPAPHRRVPPSREAAALDVVRRAEHIVALAALRQP